MFKDCLYRGRHVISAKDFNREFLEKLFAETARIKEAYNDGDKLKSALARHDLNSLLIRHGRPLRFRILLGGDSTRTSTSFEDAIETMGGVSKKDILQFSSRAKGESLRSTARILGPRTDGIIIRDDKDEDAAQKMADAIEDYGLGTVIINAGGGNKEHPTQMLTDLFTIQEYKGEKFQRGGLFYALVGDLEDSRTIHSLIIGLNLFSGRIFLVGPEEEDIPRWVRSEISNLIVIKTDDLLLVSPLVDVWYFTRLQTNLGAKTEAEKTDYAQRFGASEVLRRTMKRDSIALHPLPHGPEYVEGLDLIDPRFIHYYQADNGFFIRMALLKILFTNSTQREQNKTKDKT